MMVWLMLRAIFLLIEVTIILGAGKAGGGAVQRQFGTDAWLSALGTDTTVSCGENDYLIFHSIRGGWCD